jgi:hypothetical protein
MIIIKGELGKQFEQQWRRILMAYNAHIYMCVFMQLEFVNLIYSK